MREISEERRKMEDRIIEFCQKKNNHGKHCIECERVCPSCPINALKKKTDYQVKVIHAELVRSVDNQTAKADAGKLQLTLVPRQIVRDIAAVRMYGNQKYPEGGPENWRQVEVQRYRDALCRHLLAYLDDPMSVDPESGLLHRQHMECNMAFIAELEKELTNESRSKCPGDT